MEFYAQILKILYEDLSFRIATQQWDAEKVACLDPPSWHRSSPYLWKPGKALSCRNNLHFSYPCIVKKCAQGSAKGQSGSYGVCEREKEDEWRKWKRRLGENKCNMDKRALLIGLRAHRFRYITSLKREWKCRENKKKEEGVRRVRIC